MNDKRTSIKLSKCSKADLEILKALSIETYEITFRSYTTDEIMQIYLNKAFSSEKLGNELIDPASSFYFLYAEDKLAGYIKLNEANAQSDIHDPASLELERIYLLEAFQGKGLGGCLMQSAIDIAVSSGKNYLWLGVWEKNDKAIGFYKKYGFEIVGGHPFYMGNDKQNDYIMRKDLN